MNVFDKTGAASLRTAEIAAARLLEIPERELELKPFGRFFRGAAGFDADSVGVEAELVFGGVARSIDHDRLVFGVAEDEPTAPRKKDFSQRAWFNAFPASPFPQ